MPTEVLSYNISSEGIKVPCLEDAIDAVFPAKEVTPDDPRFFSYIETYDFPSGVERNPSGLAVFVGAAKRNLHMESLESPLLQEILDLEQTMTEEEREELHPSTFEIWEMVKEIEQNGKSGQLSVESGVFATNLQYNDILILRMQGKLTPDRIDTKINFPSTPAIIRLDPMTGEKTQVAIEDTLLNGKEFDIPLDHPTAKFPDRAIALYYDPITEVSFLGVSEGVLFDSRDVREALVIRKEENITVAEAMRQRWIDEGILSENGKFLDENGQETDKVFDTKNPQQYLGQSRDEQITTMLIALKQEARTWREAHKDKYIIPH